ncbi:Uridine diphosphate glucose pyrophosphatase [hydrothermal vent metagenome]|uniref:Uridine diphosphate glucose pyrophosphatase n=1 Tax=hydrothermal vent metagenome TaxID=652676 RepID=A0A1W1BF18_9ZZZZ
MQQVKIDEIIPLKDPKFITPVRINYTQNGIKKSWEAIKSHNSVAILLYHEQKDAFLLVRQLRIATLLNNEEEDGYTIELCAGIVDKEISLIEIAKEEILEECGYDVPIEKIERISSYYTSVGFSGARQTMFYAKIDESMKVGDGGGIDDEEIELFFLPVAQAKEFMFDESYKKTPGLMMAFYWFFDTIPHG